MPNWGIFKCHMNNCSFALVCVDCIDNTIAVNVRIVCSYAGLSNAGELMVAGESAGLVPVRLRSSDGSAFSIAYVCVCVFTGGLAAYLHADRWANAVGEECRVVAVPDSGCVQLMTPMQAMLVVSLLPVGCRFFVDYQDCAAPGGGNPGCFRSQMQFAFQTANASACALSLF